MLLIAQMVIHAVVLSVTNYEPHCGVTSTNQTCYNGLLWLHSADDTHWLAWK